MIILETRGLFAGYGDRAVLRGVDLRLSRGDRAAVIGPNGSGKTTLLRALAGIVPPSAGGVSLLGQDLARLDRRERARRVATVPQTISTPFAFTAREVAALGRTPYVGTFGALSRRDHDAIDRALAEVDAIALADRPFSELSGGERQRVVLAMALAQEPDVLLLDEPTTHLDIAHELRVLELIRDLAASRRLTVLAVMHDIALAVSRFERVVVLDRGRVVADGIGRDIVTVPLLRSVFGVRARMYWHEGVAAIVPQVPSAATDRSAS